MDYGGASAPQAQQVVNIDSIINSIPWGIANSAFGGYEANIQYVDSSWSSTSHNVGMTGVGSSQWWIKGTDPASAAYRDFERTVYQTDVSGIFSNNTSSEYDSLMNRLACGCEPNLANNLARSGAEATYYENLRKSNPDAYQRYQNGIWMDTLAASRSMGLPIAYDTYNHAFSPNPEAEGLTAHQRDSIDFVSQVFSLHPGALLNSAQTDFRVAATAEGQERFAVQGLVKYGQIAGVAGVGPEDILAAGVSRIAPFGRLNTPWRMDISSSTVGQLDNAYHYTQAKWVESIRKEGLRINSYVTPNGELSGIQAQLDLSLPPTRPLPDARIRIDLDAMNRDGYDIPSPTRVSNVVRDPKTGRVYSMPGGGYEIQLPYSVPPKYIKVSGQ